MPRKDFLSALLAGVGLTLPLGKRVLAQSATQSGGATKVMLIRHAEKPVSQ